jgi:hypothetical protein
LILRSEAVEFGQGFVFFSVSFFVGAFVFNSAGNLASDNIVQIPPNDTGFFSFQDNLAVLVSTLCRMEGCQEHQGRFLQGVD